MLPQHPLSGLHPVAWGHAFLPHHFPSPSPPFHWELGDLIAGTDPQVAVAAPRGHAKSTCVTLSGLLQQAGERRFSYALLVTDSSEQGELFLGELKRECETNEDLLRVYPGLRPAKPWKVDDLCFRNGVRIQAVGAGRKLRGRKHRGSRPDLILCDDLENDEMVASLERRVKLRRWFRAVLMPALSLGGRIVIVGTILHRDSLLSRLVRNRRWTRRLWAALSEDGLRSLWPARFSPAFLLAEKEEAREDGLLAVWYQERQNRAIADEEQAFRTEDFRAYDQLPPEPPGMVRRWTKSLYVDPAISESQKADFTAYSVVYASHDGEWYVEEAFRRRDDPAKLIETVRELHAKHGFDVIGIEAVAYQRSIAFWLKFEDTKEGGLSDLPIEAVIPDLDKRRRILALQPFYRAHRIHHRRSIGSRLEEELLNLDSIDHEDLADSLAGHLLITVRPEPPKKRAKRFENSRDTRAYRHRQEMERHARLKRLGIEE